MSQKKTLRRLLRYLDIFSFTENPSFRTDARGYREYVYVNIVYISDRKEENRIGPVYPFIKSGFVPQVYRLRNILPLIFDLAVYIRTNLVIITIGRTALRSLRTQRWNFNARARPDDVIP